MKRCILDLNHDNFYWATGIEDTFIPQSEPGKRSLDEYELMQHYQHWKQDIDLAAELGVQMMRYGIPWYKVNPSPGQFVWGWIDEVIHYMTEQKGITPIIDLMHYGTPLWMDNQFINPSFLKHLLEYVKAFAERYKGIVKYYTPLNEPYVNAEFCGETGQWPPYLEGDKGFVTIMKILSRGIIETVKAIKEIDPETIMVHVEATGFSESEDATLQEKVEFLNYKRLTCFDLITGRIGHRHFLHDWLRRNGVSEEELLWFHENQISLDIVGINYYPDLSVSEWVKQQEKVIQKPKYGGTERLESIVRFYYKRYKRPIFITETSVNEKHYDRTRWLRESVEAVKNLRNIGVPLIGYTWWPLYDLINWDYRDGKKKVEAYVEPMGLWQLLMNGERTFERVPTKTVAEFKKVIQQSGSVVGDLQ
ncbi:MAG TPA: family 1 glycosylhydrolase [Bacillales bacterium]|nr:family 1 glycosylhydrolase [Bacillales bacterium]